MGATRENTIVLIPALDEARTIGDIVGTLVESGLTVLVIDDGSTDNTEKEALDRGAMVVRNTVNIGKGFSIRSGIRYVIEKTRYQWIVMMDGDGQHHPEDIPGLLKATEEQTVDIVIGNRMDKTHTMPFSRYWTNRFTSWVLSSMCGQDIPDSQCGFRVLKVESMRKLNLQTDKYDIESEMIIEAAEKGLRIASVPIQTIYGEESSGINPFRDTIKFFRLVSKHSLRKNALRRNAKEDGRN